MSVVHKHVLLLLFIFSTVHTIISIDPDDPDGLNPLGVTSVDLIWHEYADHRKTLLIPNGRVFHTHKKVIAKVSSDYFLVPSHQDAHALLLDNLSQTVTWYACDSDTDYYLPYREPDEFPELMPEHSAELESPPSMDLDWEPPKRRPWYRRLLARIKR